MLMLVPQQKFFATISIVATLVAGAVAKGGPTGGPTGGGGAGGGGAAGGGGGAAGGANGNKPTGGPGTANVTAYSGGTFKCASINSVIPNDGTAGTPASYITEENGCAIANPAITANSVYTATITLAPKTKTLGCWLQLYEEGGCGFTLSNAFYGQPLPGTQAGTLLGCAQIPSGLSAAMGGLSMFCA
jgi:hypothetical protein